MNYKIYLKKNGINSVLDFQFETEYEIIDILKSETEFCFLTASGLLFHNKTTSQFIPLINCNCFTKKDNSIFVLCEDGLVCWKVDLTTKEKVNSIKGNIFKKLKDLLSKIKPKEFSIAAESFSSIYLSIKDMNVIYCLSFPDMFLYAGNYRSEYSVGTTLKSTSFNSPTSISCLNKDLMILDKGNNLIRLISDNKISIFYGKIDETLDINKIIWTPDGLFGIGETVYYISKSKKNEILKKKIISICWNTNTYLLEKEK